MTSIDSNTAVSSVGGLPGGLPPGSVALPPNTSINSQSGNNLTYSASMKNKPRAPPLAHSAKKSVFSLSGLSDHQNSVAASSGLGVKCNPGMGEGPQGGLRIGNGPHQAGRGSNPGQHVTTTSAVVSAAVSGASQQQQSNMGGPGSGARVGGGAEPGKPSSLMLWKKVQHCVVVGGAFVSAATANQANNGTVNEQHQSNPQDQVRTGVARLAATTTSSSVQPNIIQVQPDQRTVLAPK